MHLNYSTDRTPVIPVALLVGDRIRTVHAEGESPEEVDIVVESKAIEREDDAPFGASTVKITFLNAEGEQDDRKFDNATVWLSVEARTEPSHQDANADHDAVAETRVAA